MHHKSPFSKGGFRGNVNIVGSRTRMSRRLRDITDQVPQSPLVAVRNNTREVTTHQRATPATYLFCRYALALFKIWKIVKFTCNISHTLNTATQLLLQNKKGQSIDCPKVAGVGLEPHDLRVMSPTSYQLLHPAMYLDLPKRNLIVCECKNSEKF